jgi:hypothetical protein
VHNGKISACATDGQTIVTASLDGTIKLWNTDLIQVGKCFCHWISFYTFETYQQVGQFFCKSSVISLWLLHNGAHNMLVTGNELGDVNVLKWNRMC